MKKIEKKEPLFYKQYIISKKPQDWSEVRNIKHKIREYMLKEEQNHQCAYSEVRIKAENTVSHIDHYLKQEWFQDHIFDYNNLFTSCNVEFFAAKYKDKKMKMEDYQNLINPAVENPADYFEYTMTGFIVAKDLTNIKAETTIRLFNLNHRTLTERRKEKIHFLQRWAKYYSIEMLMKEIGEFDSMIINLYPQMKDL